MKKKILGFKKHHLPKTIEITFNQLNVEITFLKFLELLIVKFYNGVNFHEVKILNVCEILKKNLLLFFI